ncbi:MAG: DUF6476 family protein [Pseudomonadota bacterium]
MVQDPDEDLPEPPQLRLLRRLVTVLIAVFILAVITIVVLLVIRLFQLPQPVVVGLPAGIVVPQDEAVEAVTRAKAWIIVLTRSDTGAMQVRLYDAESGALRDVMAIEN